MAKECAAYTLLELITTLTVAGITLALAVPSFVQLIADHTVTSEVNRFVASIHLTRSESIKRGLNTVMCATEDFESCSGSIEWHNGFIIFSDRNKNRSRDDEDELLRVYQPEKHRVRIYSSRSQYGRKTLTYFPDGLGSGSTATIEFCHHADIGTPKAVIIANTGRPRVSETRPGGKEITCNKKT